MYRVGQVLSNGVIEAEVVAISPHLESRSEYVYFVEIRAEDEGENADCRYETFTDSRIEETGLKVIGFNRAAYKVLATTWHIGDIANRFPEDTSDEELHEHLLDIQNALSNVAVASGWEIIDDNFPMSSETEAS